MLDLVLELLDALVVLLVHLLMNAEAEDLRPLIGGTKARQYTILPREEVFTFAAAVDEGHQTLFLDIPSDRLFVMEVAPFHPNVHNCYII